MTDQPDVLERYRSPLARDGRKQIQARARSGPGMLVSAAVLGVLGYFAWRNRSQIAQKARPVIDNARVKGGAFLDKAAARSEVLIDEAAAKGHALVDQAKVRSNAVLARANRMRRQAAAEMPPPEVH